MINCPTCEKFDGHDCAMFGRQPGMAICPYAVERKPRNHFERVKQMTMEELAVFLTSTIWLAAMLGVNPFDGTGNDYKKCLEWLKEEIE